ncbi:MAG: glycosyltransferase family 4 protein [Limisphaerales bacterium]
MRLLVATRQLGFGGGVETHLQSVLPHLHAAGHSLALLYEDSASPPEGSDLGLVQEGGPRFPRIAARGRPIDAVLADVRSFAPDWVYNHGLYDPDLEDRLARSFPSLLFAHNYYGICISGTRCHAGREIIPCGRAFGPACLAVYLPFRCGGLNPWTMIQRYRIEARRRATLQHYAAILVASRYVASQFERNGIDPARIHRVPLFPPGVAPCPSPPQPRQISGRILFLGRIAPQKGLDHLVPALLQAQATLGRALHLVVAGDGRERDGLLAEANRKGLTTEALGWITLAQRNQILTGIDLLAVPSTWPEPFGLVGLEAACLGVPSVGYASGGIPEWLIPGVTGELAVGTPPRPAALAAAIVRALQDPAHWRTLRHGAWEHAHAWTPEAHLTRLLEVIRGCRDQRKERC